MARGSQGDGDSIPSCDPLVTSQQVSVDAFDGDVSACTLADFLECKGIGKVWRCRVKSSWTPPGSHPDFLHPATSTLPRYAPPPYNRVPPHAFVHFALPQAVRRATDRAAKPELLLNGRTLRIVAAAASHRRTTDPFRFPDTRLEVGTLRTPETFLAAWGGPAEGLEFSVDPSDACCRLVFARYTAFALPSHNYDKVSVVMRCNVKLEFPVRDVAEVHVHRNDFTLLVRLSASPLVHYRTADDDDIHETVPFDLPDDDDPWIRTSDFRPSGAIGRCWVYRIHSSSALSFYAATIVKELMSDSFQQKTTVYMRVKTVLTQGFYMCGRKYSLLAFSSNQLKDRSAWFFADDGNTTVDSISEWMGRWKAFRSVAKQAARMGQCFSPSYATVTLQPHEVNENLEDVERNGYTFSDGIGKITPDLAMEIAERLQLTAGSPPSAYQIRFAGFKGVIAVWPGDTDDGIRLSLRPSMKKFEFDHHVIEVLAWTRFQPGFLNRRIIVLLSSLKVSDAAFWHMQECMLGNLNKILSDSDVAFEIATASCSGENGNTAALMLSAGFGPRTEPHLRAMLLAIRSAQLQDLLGKTRIFVPKSRWLMGCLDELGILQYGQCFIRVSDPSLDQYFVKHESTRTKIILGTVVVANNPCLHPGDVRILEAVDVPELRHLVDCLVFPQNGVRPHPDEASGSDLDGDIYFVAWDDKLIPPRKRSSKPMDYSPLGEKLLRREVSQSDIVDFFLKNMVSDNLGMISNAHVVHADLSEHGAMDGKCIHLAELAAIAVDFAKTGKFVAMPSDLRPKFYPDFMLKEDSKSYKSEKILGRLYRSIQEASGGDWVSDEAWTLHDLPYDTDLEVSGASDFLASAWECKCLYEAQLNTLLNQYGVRTEAELVTGHFWSLPKNNSRKQDEVKERLKNAYNAFRKEYRSVFESLTSDECEMLDDDEKNRFYEMKASAWYQVTYHPKWTDKSRALLDPDYEEAMPVRLSFAWITADYLVRIKLRCHGEMEVGGRTPAGRLAAYISERI